MNLSGVFWVLRVRRRRREAGVHQRGTHESQVQAKSAVGEKSMRKHRAMMKMMVAAKSSKDATPGPGHHPIHFAIVCVWVFRVEKKEEEERREKKNLDEPLGLQEMKPPQPHFLITSAFQIVCLPPRDPHFKDRASLLHLLRLLCVVVGVMRHDAIELQVLGRRILCGIHSGLLESGFGEVQSVTEHRHCGTSIIHSMIHSSSSYGYSRCQENDLCCSEWDLSSWDACLCLLEGSEVRQTIHGESEPPPLPLGVQLDTSLLLKPPLLEHTGGRGEHTTRRGKRLGLGWKITPRRGFHFCFEMRKREGGEKNRRLKRKLGLYLFPSFFFPSFQRDLPKN